MATASLYLNFDNQCEEAFTFYKSVFGTELTSISRYGDMPGSEDMQVPEHQRHLVMNAELPLPGGSQLFGSDILPQYGDEFIQGNNFYICLSPDSREEADRIFAALAEGGKIEMNLEEMFWGDYFGSWTDKFGIQWMINTSAK